MEENDCQRLQTIRQFTSNENHGYHGYEHKMIQKLNNFIQWINRYPADKMYSN